MAQPMIFPVSSEYLYSGFIIRLQLKKEEIDHHDNHINH